MAGDYPTDSQKLAADFGASLDITENISDVPGCHQMAPGDMLSLRYRIEALIEATSATARYSAHDILKCWGCHAEISETDAHFCEECGSDLQNGTPCEITEYLTDEIVIGATIATPEGRRFSVTYPAPLVEEYVSSGDGRIQDKPVVTPMLSPVPAQSCESQECPSDLQVKSNRENIRPLQRGGHTIILTAGQASHVGQVRPIDEDALLAVCMNALQTPDPGRRTVGLFIVADGMGGAASGDVASSLAVQTIGKRLLSEILCPVVVNQQLPSDDVIGIITEAIQDAHSRMLELALGTKTAVGTTITMALVVGAIAYIANVGDSRTYLWRDGKLRRISKDHSKVEMLIDQGVITPDMVYTHPERNLISRSLGDHSAALVTIDVFLEQLEPGDRLILCCDGIWEMVHDPEIADIVATMQPQSACNELIKRANAYGADDNISVIVVSIDGACIDE